MRSILELRASCRLAHICPRPRTPSPRAQPLPTCATAPAPVSRSGSLEYTELHSRLRQGLSVSLDRRLRAGGVAFARLKGIPLKEDRDEMAQEVGKRFSYVIGQPCLLP